MTFNSWRIILPAQACAPVHIPLTPISPFSWAAGPSSLLKNPRHSECIVIQFFYHESAGAGMRGAFMDQGGLFSYIAPEARVPANHPLRKIRELVRDALGELNRSPGEALRERRPSLDSAGTVTERVAAPGILRPPVGTPADGAIGLQSLVSLVRGAFARRPDLGPDYLHEEPRPTAERRGVYQIHDQASQPPADQAAVVRRAFFGGRNADRGVGLAQELPPQGWQRRRRRRGQFPRTATQERHACEHQRSRQPSLPQGRRAGGEALLYGPRYHGESAWAGGGRQGHPRQRDCRAPRFGDNAQGQSQAGRPPHHGGRRQGL